MSLEEGINRERKSLEAMFSEDVRLSHYDLRKTYCLFRVDSIEGKQPEHKILVSFYDEKAYQPLEERDGYAGSLHVFDMGDRRHPNQYGAVASFEKAYRTPDCANASLAKLPVAGEQVSLVEMVEKAHMFTYPTGCRAYSPVCTKEEAAIAASKALGTYSAIDKQDMVSETDWREQMEDAIESAEWSVSRLENNTWEIGRYSDAGEDFTFSVTADSPEKFASEVRAYFNSFDPEEHAVMWYGANRGEPSSLRALLEDAESIESNLKDLAIHVTQAAGLMAAHEEQSAISLASEAKDMKTARDALGQSAPDAPGKQHER